MANAYDAVAYPSAVYPRTHPDRIAAIALLLGMTPGPVSTARCRVLELGGNDGTNLISLAYSRPESEFVGLDLAPAPVARGLATIAQLGLRNITLQVCDITTVDPETSGLGTFDYIIAHGLYSWTSPAAREAIMELCGRLLSERGIAYLSYNTYPGHHIREISRGMMRYHMAHFPDPTQQLAQARGVLKLFAHAAPPTDLYRQLLVSEEERIGELRNGHFFHDDLNPDNQPFYLHEFMAHAQQHGLQYLGEADLAAYREPDYPPDIRAALAQLDPEDIVTREQYIDFLRGRTFRRTLLCRQGAIRSKNTLDPAVLPHLFLAGEIQSTGVTMQGDGDPAAAIPTEVFQGPGKLRFETNQPLTKAALRILGAAWPGFVAFPDLLTRVAHALESSPSPSSSSSSSPMATALAAALLEIAMADGLELRTRPVTLCAREVSAQPTASPIARIQAASSHRLSTLLHEVLEMDDPTSRQLVQLLDGTRDRATLRVDLLQTLSSSNVNPSATPISEAMIDQFLRGLARYGLLVS